MLPERDDVGRALSADEEFLLLLAASQSCSRSFFPALVLALNTGLRRGELASLRWAQVDLEARRLRVGKSKTEAGAGRKVPLNERAFAALSAWAREFPFRRAEHVSRSLGSSQEADGRRREEHPGRGLPLARSAAHLLHEAPRRRAGAPRARSSDGMERRHNGTHGEPVRPPFY